MREGNGEDGGEKDHEGHYRGECERELGRDEVDGQAPARRWQVPLGARFRLLPLQGGHEGITGDMATRDRIEVLKSRQDSYQAYMSAKSKKVGGIGRKKRQIIHERKMKSKKKR